MKKISLFLLIALLVCSLFTGCRRMNDTTGVGTTGKPTPSPNTTGIIPMPTMTQGTTAPNSTAGSTATPDSTGMNGTNGTTGTNGTDGMNGMARGHSGPRY